MPNMGDIMPDMGIYAGTSDGSTDALHGSSTVAATSLADALFSKTQQRVLRWLYGQPGRAFFANELIKLTASGSGAVQRELARLHESGLVTSTRLGRQRMYRANPAAPIFQELHQIVLKTVGAADPIRAAITPLRSRLAAAMIYGSVAKGTDVADSDIDVLLVSDQLQLEDVYRAFEPAERALARKISPTIVSTGDYEAKRRTPGTFLHRVAEGPVISLVVDETSKAK
jgi:predicted nucleotidyltransferase